MKYKFILPQKGDVYTNENGKIFNKVVDVSFGCPGLPSNKIFISIQAYPLTDENRGSYIGLSLEGYIDCPVNIVERDGEPFITPVIK